MGENHGDNLFQKIIKEYGGAIIGGIIALILCFTELYKILLHLVIILGGVIVGNYIQKNKTKVKETR